MSLPTMGKHGVNIGTKCYHYTYFIVGFTQGLPPEFSWRWDGWKSKCSTSAETSDSPPRRLKSRHQTSSLSHEICPFKQVSETSDFLWGFGSQKNPDRFQHHPFTPCESHFSGSFMAHKLGRPYSFSPKKALFQARKGQTRPSGRSFGSRGALIKRKKLPAGRVVGRWEWATRRGHAGIKCFDEVN